jgi:homoserine kinase type II
MSVFTPVSTSDARAFLAEFALGDLESLEGIAAGVENTNYFLNTTTGEYVLTLFEKITIEDLPFYLKFMEHLAENGFNCPRPQLRYASHHRKELFGILNGKPAAIVTRLPGAARQKPNPDDCRIVGGLLAQLHEIGVDFDMGMNNWRGQAWREAFAKEAAPKLTGAENALIASENAYQAGIDDTLIPEGVIHGDLFHDNVLWDAEGAPGVIDFYFACDDLLLYDLAITVNDWCVNADATLDHERADALIEGYQDIRVLEDNERALWPAMLRRAALRTWLGRIGYTHFPQDGELTHAKDHEFTESLLRHHIECAREHTIK